MPESQSPPLRWTTEESQEAYESHTLNCGPHSLAAACGRTLEEVRVKLVDFKGYMNPTQMQRALRDLGWYRGHQTGEFRTLPQVGVYIVRVQWMGSWLNPGVPPQAAYAHTHWIAKANDWVHCALVDDARWVQIDHWRNALLKMDRKWYFTHIYKILA